MVSMASIYVIFKNDGDLQNQSYLGCWGCGDSVCVWGCGVQVCADMLRYHLEFGV